MITETIKHVLIAEPQIGCLLTQHVFELTNERNNTLWPKDFDIASVETSQLIAVFHVTKTNNHARNN